MRSWVRARLGHAPAQRSVSADDGISPAVRRPARIEDSIAKACEKYCVRRTEVLSKDSRVPVVEARRMICRDLRKQGISFPEIAHYLGINHSTAYYHVHYVGQPSPEDTTTFDPDVPDLSGEWAI